VIKVTLEFSTLAEAGAALALLGGAAAPAAATNKAPKAEKPAAEVAAPVVKALAESIAANAEPEGATAQQLTNAIVGAVGKLGRDPVIALLKDKFNVSAGKEITDPATRAKAVAAINELVGV
jgi:hypothetical protein